jgi:glutamyl/glutaminyl-tRNA synthetase
MGVCVLYEVSAAGRLTLASARTALHGWLFARHEGGQFLLYSAGYPVSLADASMLGELRFLGLDWDEVLDDRRTAAVTHVFRAAPPPPDIAGKDLSQYVPLSPIKGPDCKTELGEFVRQGYAGLALSNCLARLGWSPRGKRALLTLDELVARFELGRLSHRPVVFDRRQLDWFNRRWLCALDADEVTALLAPHWQAAYGRAERAGDTSLSPKVWQQTLALAIREELDRPDQAVDKTRFAFMDDLLLDSASRTALDQSYAKPILRAFVRELPPAVPPAAFDFEPLDAFCREFRLRFKNAQGIRSRDVMYVLRAALTGRQDGPCLVVVCQLLGPERCIQRAKSALGET